MDDVIYRKDAAKILCNWCGVCPEDQRDIMNCDDICPEFAKIPSARQWFPYNEKLPPIGEQVLVSYKGMVKQAFVTEFFEKYPWAIATIDGFVDEVDAWMPLPEPYKGKNDG